MQIILSWNELSAVRHWASAPMKELIGETRERTNAGHVVAMPAIAWRVLADRMRPETFSTVTGRHRKTRNARDGVPATRKALQKIESMLGTVGMHPAFRGEAEAGEHSEVLIAWADGRRWSLFPVAGVAPTYFVPELMERLGFGDVTVWRQRDHLDVEIPGLFANPAEHTGWGSTADSHQSGGQHPVA